MMISLSLAMHTVACFLTAKSVPQYKSSHLLLPEIFFCSHYRTRKSVVGALKKTRRTAVHFIKLYNTMSED